MSNRSETNASHSLRECHHSSLIFLFAMIRCFFGSRFSTTYVPDEFHSFAEVLDMFVVAEHVGDCLFHLSHEIAARNRYQVPSHSQHSPLENADIEYRETRGMTITQK